MQGEVKMMKRERDESREACQDATSAMAISQHSERLVQQERDRLQKEVEVLKAGAGDEGVNAAYMETMKAGYEEQIKEMNDQVLDLQLSIFETKKKLEDLNQIHKDSMQAHEQKEIQRNQAERFLEEELAASKVLKA